MKEKRPVQDHDASMLLFEQSAGQAGYRLIAGVDEAGRGPLAGPVAAEACILDPDNPIKGLDDSKKLTPAKRKALYEQITRRAVSFYVSLIEPDIIDQINILQATKTAMRQAINGLSVKPDFVLIDAVSLENLPVPSQSIVHGDARSASIAAASILAKVTRDTLMEAYDSLYPAYGFARHKGYGTRFHYQQLLREGPCPIHRLSFLRTLEDHARSLSED